VQLNLSVFDLAEPGAVDQLVREVGEAAAREIVREAGGGLFVVLGHDERFTMYKADEAQVLEVLAAALAEVGAAPKGRGGLSFNYHAGPKLAEKFGAVVAEHVRTHSTENVVSTRLDAKRARRARLKSPGL
jgi:hypothetical protein